ncbi:hypothetical protein SAMN04488069_1294 [Hymenobacter psychrophilus]|uniref:Uncharacterized protein n=1 Tax=Hymenobacter psychrophilus TaxID=651662 RepID=A0A1H3PDK5_9BACT|nr:hypothetical protein SAMN04488069_1294 [Hymenobacter psychrophilus]
MQTIKIQLLHPDAKLPTRAHPTDACYDVYAATCELGPGWAKVRAGLRHRDTRGLAGQILPP